MQSKYLDLFVTWFLALGCILMLACLADEVATVQNSFNHLNTWYTHYLFVAGVLWIALSTASILIGAITHRMGLLILGSAYIAWIVASLVLVVVMISSQPKPLLSARIKQPPAVVYGDMFFETCYLITSSALLLRSRNQHNKPAPERLVVLDDN